MRVWLFILLLCPLAATAGDFPVNAEEKKYHPPHAEDGGLRLEVNALLDDSLTSDGTTWKWGSAYLVIEIALHNISAAPITVPTTAFDRPPTIVQWPAWGSGIERIMLFIDSPEFRGKPAAYAPARFAPVTLAPGEFALLLRHSGFITDRKHADAIKEASAAFGVPARFVGPREWWRGHLQTYASIVRSHDPDKEIQEHLANDKIYRQEQADPDFLKNVPRQVATWIATADRVSFRGEEQKKSEATLLRDPQWMQRIGDAIAAVPISKRDNCLCAGWRTASFYKGDEMVVSVAAIHGQQLRIYWQGSGGDFATDEGHWKTVSAVLEEAFAASKPERP
jgi:hypothetical protein